MRSESSSSVEVIFLDNAAAVDKLRQAAISLSESDANVLSVRLFGSLGEGTATPESDADVLITVRRAEGRFFDRGDEYRDYFDDANLDIAVELFVYRDDELERMKESGNDFIKEIIETSVTLTEK